MKIEFHISVIVAGVVAFFGGAYFLFSVYQAATYFPGGYEWDQHFLSDLGSSYTNRGEPNTQSSVIFNRGLMCLAASVLPFFVLAPRQLPRFKNFVIVAGVTSSAGLIGIAMTPYDQYFVLHNCALAIWIVPMLLTMVAFVMDWIDQGRSPYLITLVTGIVFVACFLYLAGFTHQGHVVFQKVLVVCAVSWVLIVASIISFTVSIAISSRKQLAEKEAVEYLNQLKRGHRRR